MRQEPTPASPSEDRASAPADVVRSAFRGFRALGMTEQEAGNLSAHLAGLEPISGGWELVEIERLLFIRSLVESGRLRP